MTDKFIIVNWISGPRLILLIGNNSLFAFCLSRQTQRTCSNNHMYILNTIHGRQALLAYAKHHQPVIAKAIKPKRQAQNGTRAIRDATTGLGLVDTNAYTAKTEKQQQQLKYSCGGINENGPTTRTHTYTIHEHVLCIVPAHVHRHLGACLAYKYSYKCSLHVFLSFFRSHSLAAPSLRTARRSFQLVSKHTQNSFAHIS